MSSPRLIDVSDLQVGMHIRLDLGWMSHPFPRSSFRITSSQQIATIRGLGVRRVAWYPAMSVTSSVSGKLDARISGQAKDDAAGGFGAGSNTASSADAPDTAPVDAQVGVQVDPHADAGARSQAHSPAERAAAERRQQLQAQREEMQHCQAQYDEAADALRQVGALADSQPLEAAQQARALASAMRDKMLGAGELCIRLLSTASNDRAVAHGLNVTVLAMLMARAVGLPEAELLDLGTGALLHDIGKLDLPARVHHPEDNFSSAELKAYRDHVSLGVARARRMQLPPEVVAVLAQHHEMADGSGYPERLMQDAITPAARLVALVNRYDNLCNPGPRGVPLTPHEAVSVLFAQNRNKFDMPILSSFIRMMGVYPAGSVVQLTDERFALVMQVNSSRPLKPRVLVHDARLPRDEALLLDLEQTPDLGIRRSVAPARLPAAAASYLTAPARVSYYFDVVAAAPEPAELLLAEAS